MPEQRYMKDILDPIVLEKLLVPSNEIKRLEGIEIPEAEEIRAFSKPTGNQKVLDLPWIVLAPVEGFYQFQDNGLIYHNDEKPESGGRKLSHRLPISGEVIVLGLENVMAALNHGKRGEKLRAYHVQSYQDIFESLPKDMFVDYDFGDTFGGNENSIVEANQLISQSARTKHVKHKVDEETKTEILGKYYLGTSFQNRSTMVRMVSPSMRTAGDFYLNTHNK